MEIPKSLEPFQGRIKGIRHHHYDCYWGKCPLCGCDGLKIFERSLEVRCLSCGTESTGVAQFLEKFIGEETAQVEAKEIDLPEEEAPESKKAGKCEVCGAEFEILPYTRRKRRYCGSRCSKRAERQRKRGRDLETSS